MGFLRGSLFKRISCEFPAILLLDTGKISEFCFPQSKMISSSRCNIFYVFISMILMTRWQYFACLHSKQTISLNEDSRKTGEEV